MRYASVEKQVSAAKPRMNLDEMGDEEDQARRFYNPMRNELTLFSRKNPLTNVQMLALKELNPTMTSMKNTTMITPKTTLTMARAMIWMI